VARRPLEREEVYLDGGRRTTQLMRDSLGSSPTMALRHLIALGILTACSPKGPAAMVLTGQVVDSVNGKGLPRARIEVGFDTTTADSTGRFALHVSGPPTDSVRILFRYIGFKPLFREVPWQTKSPHDLGAIQLRYAPVQVDDFVVDSVKRPQSRP